MCANDGYVTVLIFHGTAAKVSKDSLFSLLLNVNIAFLTCNILLHKM